MVSFRIHVSSTHCSNPWVSLLTMSLPDNARGISAPIGEYSSEDSEFMPLVATFIASLPEGSAFRLSLHSWARPEASQAARALMGPNDTVLYGVRVYIDGRNSAYGLLL